MSSTNEPGVVMTASPPPIPGRRVDPAPKSLVAPVANADARGVVVGNGYRAFLRFTHANGSLLAAGTTYYLFLAVIALLVVAFGLAALFGGDRFAATLTESVSNAFPGLVGDQGLSTETLQEVGQATSLVGLFVLLYSGSGSIVALSRSLHVIYGAPKDPRPFVLARARLLAWLLLLAPLAALSFVPSVLVTNFAKPVINAIGAGWTRWEVPLIVLTIAVALLLNATVIWLILGHLGGIRPANAPRIVGTAFGAVAIEILKYLLSVIIAWSISKPQFGALAAPIAMLLVLFLECTVVYLAAAITAGAATATHSGSGASGGQPLPEDPLNRAGPPADP